MRPPLYSKHWINRYIDEDFFRHFWMYRNMFQMMWGIILSESSCRVAVPLEKGLLFTLYYLAKGDTIILVSEYFNGSLSATHRLLNMVVGLINTLNAKYFSWPTADKLTQYCCNFSIKEAIQVCEIYPKSSEHELITFHFFRCNWCDRWLSYCHKSTRRATRQLYLNRKFFHSVII